MSFTVIPAIDLRGRRVVRLRQGDYARETMFDVDPVELAWRYADAGAQWLHVVDLDGALAGALDNLSTIEAIARTGTAVQAGGGVRSEADLQRLFDAGALRVVVGSLAVREPGRVEEWLSRHGAERIVIALDTRWREGAWRLPVHGWTEQSKADLDTLASHYVRAGARWLLCTDIDRDGMDNGPNLDLYEHLAQMAPELSALASGGVRDMGDVHALRAHAGGVILGRSLLEGRMTIGEALSC